jgi:hypothetical protein
MVLKRKGNQKKAPGQNVNASIKENKPPQKKVTRTHKHDIELQETLVGSTLNREILQLLVRYCGIGTPKCSKVECAAYKPRHNAFSYEMCAVS